MEQQQISVDTVITNTMLTVNQLCIAFRQVVEENVNLKKEIEKLKPKK